jgi:hypothetical protein
MTMLMAYVNASDMDGVETLMKGYSKLNNVERVMRV